MSTIEDLERLLTEIRDYVTTLPQRLLINAGQIVIYSGLSDISETLGIIRAGEFRAGNTSDPGRGFSGMRMVFPPVSYNSELWNLVGIENDVMQFGVRASDGKLVAGGGAVVLDEDGINAIGGTIGGWVIQTDRLESPTGQLILDSTGSIRTGGYVSGVNGWSIGEYGDAEFNNIIARGEIRTSVLTYQEVQAVSGTTGIYKSAGVLYNDADIFDPPPSTLDIRDPAYGHVALFAVNDRLLIKIGTNATWFIVNNVSDMTTYYRYSVTRQSGTNNILYPAGTAVVNYGQANQGFLYMTADEQYSPYFSVRKHSGSPWSSTTELIRIGNLQASWDYSSGSQKYGIAIGQYAPNKANITLDEDGMFRIRNYQTDILKFWFDSPDFKAEILGTLRMPGTNSAITIGATPPTSATAGTGLYINRTGLYSLLNGTQQVKIDAVTGALFFGQNNGKLDSTGLSLTPAFIDVGGFQWQNAIRWIGPNTEAQISGGYIVGDNKHGQFYLWSNSSVQNGGSAIIRLETGVPMPGTEYAGVAVETTQQLNYNGRGQVQIWGGYTSITVEGSGSAGGNNKITISGDVYVNKVPSGDGGTLLLENFTVHRAQTTNYVHIRGYQNSAVLTNPSGRRQALGSTSYHAPFLRWFYPRAFWAMPGSVQGAARMLDITGGHHLVPSNIDAFYSSYNGFGSVGGYQATGTTAYLSYATLSHFGMTNYFTALGWFYIPSTTSGYRPLIVYGDGTPSWKLIITATNLLRGEMWNTSNTMFATPNLAITANAWNLVGIRFVWVSSGNYNFTIFANGTWSGNSSDPGSVCRNPTGSLTVFKDGSQYSQNYIIGSLILGGYTAENTVEATRIWEETRPYFNR